MALDRVGKYWPQTLSIVRILIGSTRNGHVAMGSGCDRVRWRGLLLTVGLFTRLAALVLAGVMAAAYFMGHATKNLFPLLNGGEAEILYCLVFLVFFVAGPGPWSIDKSSR